jgi:hypothetical protein
VTIDIKRNDGRPRMDSNAKATGESKSTLGDDGGKWAVNVIPTDHGPHPPYGTHYTRAHLQVRVSSLVKKESLGKGDDNGPDVFVVA